MRYFDISIDPVSSASGETYGEIDVSGKKGLRFQTHPNGLQKPPDMGALHVVMDLPVVTFDAPNGAAYIEIRGVDIQTIAQASNLQGAQVTISGGMGKGLPLAKTEQAGILLSGSVYQAFGNWVDTNMSLNLMIQPFAEPITDENYPKFVWHWQSGQNIKDAITQTITNAMPGYTCDFSWVSQTLLAGSVDAGFYPDIGSLAQVILSASQSAVADKTYPGIRFYVRNKVFYFYDTSSLTKPKEIQFEDLVGQPTWLGPVDFPKIVFQTVMRADIALGDVITMPFFNQSGNKTTAGYGSIAPSSTSITSPKQRSLFIGNYQITSVRHLGDSRNPSGDAWITVFEAVKQ